MILRTCFLLLGLATAVPASVHRPLNGAAQDPSPTPANELVRLRRCPDNGLHPRTVAFGRQVHLIYFLGAPEAGDLYYAFSDDHGASFSEGLRVNDQESAVDVQGGTRAASLAVTAEGSVHVVWLGSQEAEPRGPSGESPVLYSRLDPMQGTFAAARNLAHTAYGLNTGPVVAAHAEQVYVFWHAPAEEEAAADAVDRRRIWLARSSDGGLSFAPEVAIDPEQGVSEQSGIDAATRRDGTLYLAYRTSGKKGRRHSHLMHSTDGGATFGTKLIANWKRQNCPASTVSLTTRGKQVYSAWEQFGTVGWSPIDPMRHTAINAREPKADKQAWRTRPTACAMGKLGLIAWMEGEKRKPPLKLGWQTTNLENGQRVGLGWVEDLDPRSTPSVFAHKNGFTILY